jgi:hypothetical protein
MSNEDPTSPRPSVVTSTGRFMAFLALGTVIQVLSALLGGVAFLIVWGLCHLVGITDWFGFSAGLVAFVGVLAYGFYLVHEKDWRRRG